MLYGWFALSMVVALHTAAHAQAPAFLVKDIGSPLDDGRLELWTSDGTATGSELLRTIEGANWARNFMAVDGTMFFVTYRVGGGYRSPRALALWKTDGTTDGTVAVTPIASDTVPNQVGTALDGVLLFDHDGPSGQGLYRVNATAADATLVKAVQAVDLRNIGGRVVFQGCDAAGGCEVWESDGTTVGTRRLADVAPGPFSSQAHAFAVTGSLLFFSATSEIAGDVELWAVPLADFGLCGNTRLDAGEECDAGGETATCDGDCTRAECGDANVNTRAGEECDDGNAPGGCCTAACTPQPNGSSCTDADVCNGAETCDGVGTCQSGTALDCDDENADTSDSCEPVSGCAYTAIGVCAGDCNGDLIVSVDELVTLVNEALDTIPNPAPAPCSVGDTNQDGQITVAEIIAAVGRALNGCALAADRSREPTG